MVRGRFHKPLTEDSSSSQNSRAPRMKTRLTGQQKQLKNDQQCITNFFKINNFKQEELLGPDCELTITIPSNIEFCKQEYFNGYNKNVIITSFEKPAKIQKTEPVSFPGSPLHRIELNSDELIPDLNPKIKNRVQGISNSNERKLTEFFPIRRSVRKTKKTVQEEKQKSLEERLRTGVEDGLEVHHFNGKGRGVVATKSFNRGDFVVEYSGELLDMVQAKQREEKYAQDTNTGCYMYYFKYQNRQYCIDATAETGRLGRLINHSRNGNLITRTVVVDTLPRLVLIAKDFINVGEELSYDYGDRSKESLKHHPWLAL